MPLTSGRLHWVGIDEAGYGPNLGPLVMTAVTAEGPATHEFDLWRDLNATVARCGVRDDRLWVDDSKQIYRNGKGIDRLELATLSIVKAISERSPDSLAGLLRAVASDPASLAEYGKEFAGLSDWLDGSDPRLPRHASSESMQQALGGRPFDGAPWRLVGCRAMVVPPRCFNEWLELGGSSKAAVHFRAFRALLEEAWAATESGTAVELRSDKHGGRHFYYELLLDAFPDTWIDRIAEGPHVSHYVIRSGSRRLTIRLQPKADSVDGLVALASMVSKTIRELWMEVFNAFWTARIPGLKPTAGYPVDAARFRAEIESLARELGLDPAHWWRLK